MCLSLINKKTFGIALLALSISLMIFMTPAFARRGGRSGGAGRGVGRGGAVRNAPAARGFSRGGGMRSSRRFSNSVGRSSIRRSPSINHARPRISPPARISNSPRGTGGRDNRLHDRRKSRVSNTPLSDQLARAGRSRSMSRTPLRAFDALKKPSTRRLSSRSFRYSRYSFCHCSTSFL